MAVTQGHGNPNWNRDETILALEAYFALAGKNPNANDPLIIALSQTLRALPYHSDAARKPTFRNPDGAAFKVQNLRSRATGKGLGNISQMDRDIWDEFGTNPIEVTRLANLIRAGMTTGSQASPATSDGLDDLEFYEGRLLTQNHMRRERSAKLRQALLKKREQSNSLHCDMCGDDHAALPHDLRTAAFEAHHVLPIALAGEGSTKLSDVALLCATCHRLLHRLIAIRRKWIGVSDATAVISASAPAQGYN